MTGDRADDLGRVAELWRTAFLGWGVEHVLTAPTLCRPEGFVVVDERTGRLRSAGSCRVGCLLPDDELRLRVPSPSAGG